ncbi:MAG: amidase, partial [Maricaulaceae bacterium]
TLEDLIAFNEAHADIELALFDQSLFEQAQKAVDVDDLDFRAARARIQKRVREDGIDRLLAEHEVDILVSPSGVVASQIDTINGDVWPAWAGAGSMAAVAGYPHVSVPMGTVQGLPVGFSFIGAKDTDAAVLSFGYAYEQATNHRVDPQYLPNAEARPEIAAAIEGRG